MAIFGLFLILFGALAIVNEFISINFWHYFSLYWPLLFVIAAIHRIILRRKNDFLSWGSLVLFSLIQIQRLQLFHGNIWKVFLGIFIIYLGYQLIFPQKRRSIYTFTTDSRKDDSLTSDEQTNQYRSNSNNNDREEVLDTDMLDESITFNHKDYKIQSQTFSGGNIDLIFSQCRLNFLDTVPMNYITNLECRLKASQLIIQVPDDWEVNFDDGRLGKSSFDHPNYILNIKEKSMGSNIVIV
ncbi:MAG: hypothetical protein Q4P28_00740 [Tissierellia bacterium]|nr:hypothetical protein [Tissierellia bacterium]